MVRVRVSLQEMNVSLCKCPESDYMCYWSIGKCLLLCVCPCMCATPGSQGVGWCCTPADIKYWPALLNMYTLRVSWALMEWQCSGVVYTSRLHVSVHIDIVQDTLHRQTHTCCQGRTRDKLDWVQKKEAKKRTGKVYWKVKKSVTGSLLGQWQKDENMTVGENGTHFLVRWSERTYSSEIQWDRLRTEQSPRQMKRVSCSGQKGHKVDYG